MMNKKEMTWTDIFQDMRESLEQQESPGLAAASVFITMMAACASATGRMPNRVAAGVNRSLSAYYFGASGHAGFEVYPKKDSEPNNLPEGILFWSGTKDDYAEDIRMPTMLEEKRYRTLMDFLKEAP